MIFKDSLKTHWQDFDGTLFDLAVSLGIVKEDEEPYPRWLFVEDNMIAVALDHILFELVDIGAIEINEESQYRWNEQFHYNGFSKISLSGMQAIADDAGVPMHDTPESVEYSK